MKRLILILAAAVALAACGGNKQLNIRDKVRVAQAQAVLAATCLGEGSVFDDGSDPVETLTTVFQAHAGEMYDHVTLRQSIASEINDLEGCDSRDAEKLRTLLLGQ